MIIISVVGTIVMMEAWFNKKIGLFILGLVLIVAGTWQSQKQMKKQISKEMLLYK